MMNLIDSKSNTFDKWQETFSKVIKKKLIQLRMKNFLFFFFQYFQFDLSSDPETSAIFDEFYGIIDVDGDGIITSTEIEQINGVVGIIIRKFSF